MRLKVMYFLDDGQRFGGAANTLLQQAVLMRRSGYEILLCISNDRKEEMAEEYLTICEKISIGILRLPFQISSQPEDVNVVSLLANYAIVRDAVRTYAPDLIHSIQINPIAELVSRELKIPHIMNIYQIQDSFFSVHYTDIFPRYHICDSRYYADIWKRLIRSDSVCVRTVADRAFQGRAGKQKTGTERIRYCCAGGIYTRKNQLEVIKAFEMAVSDGVEGELFFYGYDRGQYADQCKEYIRERKLDGFIKIKGFCSEMEDAYEKAEVLICGSTCESYPNVISEALAHGLVVISTPVAGVPEIIRDGYNGYLCGGYSKADIYEKIMQFDRERKSGKVKALLHNADDTYKKVHSPESVSSELITYYHHVLEDACEYSGVMIGDIREMFSQLVNLYHIHSDVFARPYMVETKLWYIHHIKGILERQTAERKEHVYIWGAGRLAETVKTMIETFLPFLRVCGFIDSSRQGELFGLPIHFPGEILMEKNNLIFVGMSNGQEEAVQSLERSSRVYGQDYFVLAPRKW